MANFDEYMHKGITYANKKKKEAIWLLEIATLEKDIRSNYEEIGKMYYNASKLSKETTDFDYYIRRIQDLEKEIAVIRRKLKEISNTQ